jgi:alpha-D-ribose 1-methylphosphonate 5-triphosphate synthase subunit PhnG
MTVATASSHDAPAEPSAHAERRAWLAVLARAETGELEAGLQLGGPGLHYAFLRQPERGMVMLRARVGGTGDVFNVGEATVTRCTVRLADGAVGSGHVLGRDRRKAELVAVLDALLQQPAHRARLEDGLLAGLRTRQQARREAEAAAAGSSRVSFFTMVRGE